MIPLPRRLIVGLLLAGLIMGIGFWLKWRVLSPFDEMGWYLQSTSQFGYSDIIGVYIERDVASSPLPYAEMELEYPPVVGIVMYLTSFAGGAKGFLLGNY